jgi:plasmid maintenance system antidote protein VapI
MPHNFEFLKDLEAFESTPEARGYDLRLDLADIVLRHLGRRNVSQRQLARAIGVPPSYLTKIIHSAQNCTFEAAGKIFYALGIKGKLIEAVPSNTSLSAETTSDVIMKFGKKQVIKDTNGKKSFYKIIEETDPGTVAAVGPGTFENSPIFGSQTGTD